MISILLLELLDGDKNHQLPEIQKTYYEAQEIASALQVNPIWPHEACSSFATPKFSGAKVLLVENLPAIELFK